MKRLLPIIFAIITFAFPIHAQVTDSTNRKPEQAGEKKQKKKDRPPKKGYVSITPGPILGANPANGVIFGVGAAISAYFGEPDNTSLSSGLLGISYTSKQQLLVTIKSSIYLAKNRFILNGDWQYLDSSQPTWGLGTGPQSAKLLSSGFKFEDKNYKGVTTEQMLTYNFFRFYQTALTKISPSIFAGIGFHLDQYSDIDDQMVDLDAPDPTVTSYYAYNTYYGFNQDKSNLVGISINSIYDSRDNQNNPHKGRYANISFKMNTDWLGSEKSSSTLWLEYRDYWDINKNHKNIIGFWTWGNVNTSGKLPYLLLPAIGTDQYGKSGRPYALGRFRGQSMLYAETEFRKRLISTRKDESILGAVLFLNGTSASAEENNIQLLDYINVGFGLGVRIMLSRSSRTNLGLDYGWGNYGTQGLYIRINETF